jgi:transposase
MLWCVQRLFVKTPSGRQRLNVLAALNAITHDIFTVQNLTYVTAATVCELLRLLAGAYPGQPITIILDNARYQRCTLVQEVAASWGIELLFLPPYSPNLNRIERLWKFVKKRCLYGKYDAESAAFQQAMSDGIAQAHTKDKVALESLRSWQLQTFKAVPIVGDQSPVVMFPVAKHKRSTTQKVSTKAA